MVDCSGRAVFNSQTSKRVTTPDLQVEGQGRIFPTRCFYNSGCNIADVKSLLVRHKYKLSQYKSSNRSREWGFTGEHFRGGQSPVNARSSVA